MYLFFVIHLQAFSGGVDLSLASPKLEASNTPERRMRNILHNLEEIQEKLWENFTWKEALEQREGELLLFGERGLNMEVGGNDKVLMAAFWGQEPRALLYCHCGVIRKEWAEVFCGWICFRT